MELLDILRKNNATKWLDNAVVGTYVTVCINNDIRCISLYIGKDEDNHYSFIDSDGIFKFSKQFIQNNDISLDAIRGEKEMIMLANLINNVEKGGRII